MTDIPLFTPLTIRGVTFRNRVVLAPMCQYRAVNGLPTRWHRSHHGRLALSGLGAAIFEATAVLPEGRITPGCLGIWSDAHADALTDMVAAYHDEGTKVGIQLAHAGRKASAATPFDGAQPLPSGDANAWTSVAPSALAFGPNWQTPHELTEAEILAIIAAFGAAGRRAVAAGFDFVEIHAAHGYLINSFTSPVANQRTDSWGGANRFRFATEIARALRAALPATMPIFCRISQEDGVDGGITLADSVALAAALKAEGVDVIDCSSGGISGPSGGGSAPPKPGYLVPGAARIRAEASVATMAVGLIMDGVLANRIIADAQADLVAVGRELLADSAFVHRAAIALGHPDPHGVLPQGLGFWLQRRRWQD